MTDSCNEFTERLFLLKSDLEEISVPCNDLAQHQIDGIRFLFKQYKKSNKAIPMTRDETMLLVQLVAANKIINNKATNATNNKLKEEAWQSLTNEFNSSVSSFHRTSSQLRLKWENLKKTARKRCANLRHSLNKMKQGVIINYASGCGASAQVAIFISSIHAELEKPLLILYDKEEEKEEWLERFNKWTTISADSIVVNPSNAFVKKLIHINNIANIDKLCGRQWSIVVVKSDEVNHKFMRYPLKVNFKIWITSVDMKKGRTALNVIYAWIYDKSKAQINKYLDYKTDAKESFINSLLLDSLLEDVLLTRRDLTPFQASKRQLDSEIKLGPKISRKNKDATGMKIKRTKKNVDAPSTSIAHCAKNQPNTHTSTNIKIDNKDEETKLDVESFIRDNLPLESDSNLSMALRNLEDTFHPNLSASSKTEDDSTDSSAKLNSTVDKVVHFDILGPNTKVSVELINDSSQESLAVGNETEVGRGRSISPNPILIQDSSRSSQNSHKSFLELSNGSIQESAAVYNDAGRYSDKPNLMMKIEEDFSFGVVKNKYNDNVNNHAIVNETNKVSSDSNEVVADQERKLELTTRVTQETDSSFDSKMRQMEERALKKFKGSFLDNIFKM